VGLLLLVPGPYSEQQSWIIVNCVYLRLSLAITALIVFTLVLVKTGGVLPNSSKYKNLTAFVKVKISLEKKKLLSLDEPLFLIIGLL
jgi:hypothetical protein